LLASTLAIKQTNHTCPPISPVHQHTPQFLQKPHHRGTPPSVNKYCINAGPTVSKKVGNPTRNTCYCGKDIPFQPSRHAGRGCIGSRPTPPPPPPNTPPTSPPRPHTQHPIQNPKP